MLEYRDKRSIDIVEIYVYKVTYKTFLVNDLSGIGVIYRPNAYLFW